jgi:threonine dehydrogenase-like Zn-dependent dehydrogenase
VKSLVWHGDQDLRVEDLPDPQPPEGHVALDVLVAGICGSDLHGYRGHPGPRVPPLVLGHEAVGTVGGRAGRFVPFPLAVCGSCPACRRGMGQLCQRRGLLGLDRPGVFAEQVVVPESALVAVPAGMSDAVAALTEPYAVGLSAIKQERISEDYEVLVLGAGPIGALTVHAAVRTGARVTAVDPVPRRREVADLMGAHQVLDSSDAAPARAFDVVVDSVGTAPTWLAAIRATRRGGSIAIVGLGAAEGSVPVGELVREALTLRGHYAYTRADFEQAITELESDPPDLEWVSMLPLSEGAAGFEGLVEHPETFAKVMLEIGEQKA